MQNILLCNSIIIQLTGMRFLHFTEKQKILFCRNMHQIFIKKGGGNSIKGKK